MTPDNLPIFGRGPLANLWVNAGHGHMGWTWAWARPGSPPT